MRGLVPRIHVFMVIKEKTWMAVTSTAMTTPPIMNYFFRPMRSISTSVSFTRSPVHPIVVRGGGTLK